MEILITKHFSKWAKKNPIDQATLKKAALEVLNGNVEANLGSHLFKKRIGLPGQGKRGAVRVILFYQINNRLIYVHGFMKKDKNNLSAKEFKVFKVLSDIFLDMTDIQYKTAIKNGDFEEI